MLYVTHLLDDIFCNFLVTIQQIKIYNYLITILYMNVILIRT